MNHNILVSILERVGYGLERVESPVRRALKWVSIVTVFLMIFVINIQIFFRYVLNNALSWPEGFAVLLNIWLTYIAGAIAYYEGDHVSISYFRRKMPDMLARASTVLLNGVVILLALSMAYFGSQLAIDQADGQTIYLNISLFWTRIPIAIGGAYLVVEASRRAVEALTTEMPHPDANEGVPSDD